MATTPSDTSRRIDQIIDSLNAHWDLGLPRPYGVDEGGSAQTGLLAKRCYERIRFFCYKTNNIDALLEDFHVSARQIHSGWVFKPSQERGTLPVLPQTKSMVERDLQDKRKSGVVRLSDSQRLRLQERLFQILDENYELAKLSRTYSTETVSSTPFNTAPSTPRKQIMASKEEAMKAPGLKNPVSKSAKRTLNTPDGVSLTSASEVICTYSWSQQNKRQYRQQTLSQFLQLKPAPPPQVQASPAPAFQHISFETAPSPAVSSVFTTPEEPDGLNVSNATSMLSSEDEESQDLFPTQDIMELDQDEDFRRSVHEAFPPPPAFDPTDLLRNTPFKKHDCLPREAPFWYTWEIHRLAPLTGLEPFQLYQKVRQSDVKNEFSGDRLYDTVKTYLGKDRQSLLARSDLPTWMTSQNRYWNQEKNTVVYFTAALEWSEDPHQGLFQLQLNPVQLEQSCRLYRKFGADRFVVLSTPVFSSPPEKIRSLAKDHVPLHKKITDFLASNQHFIGGRYWRICFAEAAKKARPKSENRIKITLFAETGFDIIRPPPANLGALILGDGRRHLQIMLEDLMQWHIPIGANFNSPDLKLFSRWSLGFSKTRPTVELDRHEFLHLPDKLGDEPVEEPGGKRAHQVMNDGCALISYSLARAVWAAYGREGEVPSAFQGRISGAKGLWIVDYQGRFPDVSQRGFWIQVSDSQLKIKPHPRERIDADATQRTFEVLNFARDCTPAYLNKQLVTILEDRRVPRRVFREALEEDVKSYSESLTDALSDNRRLELWMQEHGYYSLSEDVKFLGSFPARKKHQVKPLLHAGFHPLNCEQLMECATDLLKDHMARYLEKMWIKLPYSTSVYCAPDPCDVLAEDEVFLSSPAPLVDPRTGISETALDNIMVLVARNPAHLASDIQLRKAVYKHELRNYKNVILFSTRGKKSTAALLSGGDYDGDVVTCIWDPRFTERFCNAQMPQMPTQGDCGMINKSRPLSEIFQGPQYDTKSMQDFLQGCLSFNTTENLLGTCTSEWEKLVYSLSKQRQNETLSQPAAISLAALAGYLVDSRKQGWSISMTDWYSFRKKATGHLGLPTPGYKDGKAPTKSTAEHLNVIDHLTFDVAEREKDRVLADMHARRKKVGTYDRDLSHYWRREEEKMRDEQVELKASRLPNAKMSPNGQVTPTLSDILKGDDGLQGQISRLCEMWKKMAPPPLTSSFDSPKGGMNNSKSAAAVQEVYQKFKAIAPMKVHHRLRLRYEEEEAERHHFAYWALLRASCLYAYLTNAGRTFPWWAWQIAGRDLCDIKALRSPGRVTPVVAEIRGLQRVDTKFTRQLLERGVAPDDDGAFVEDSDEDLIEEDFTTELE
ncbi:hypothetical protein PV04_04218 [Phialophora macrospora]|uniref:RNA-dependent RNA polymerase n=1 Tax=Phialophora macrospora TaxID=1851006 RepID=A0A0D2CSU9_9EURO|nr:hypothetical protein PV04_04218 [Phialophora macrospora]